MNPYIEIIRPSITLMSAFGVLVGAVVAGYSVSPLLGLAMLSAFLISAGGLVINDFYDLETDKINAPQRPIPSGRLSKRKALLYCILLLASGILASYFINYYCLALACINALLGIVYARWLKGIAIIGNATDSWFVASTFLFGAFLTMDMSSVWIVSLLAFLANMGREIFGDIEDIAGDSKLGLKTLPIIWGNMVSLVLGGFFILAAVAMSVLPIAVGIFGFPYAAIVAVADALFILSLFQKPRENQKTTKVAMIIALFAFLAGALL